MTQWNFENRIRHSSVTCRLCHGPGYSIASLSYNSWPLNRHQNIWMIVVQQHSASIWLVLHSLRGLKSHRESFALAIYFEALNIKEKWQSKWKYKFSSANISIWWKSQLKGHGKQYLTEERLSWTFSYLLKLNIEFFVFSMNS